MRSRPTCSGGRTSRTRRRVTQEPGQILVLALRPADDPHCAAMYEGQSTCFTYLWTPNWPKHVTDPAARGAARIVDGNLVLRFDLVPMRSGLRGQVLQLCDRGRRGDARGHRHGGLHRPGFPRGVRRAVRSGPNCDRVHSAPDDSATVATTPHEPDLRILLGFHPVTSHPLEVPPCPASLASPSRSSRLWFSAVLSTCSCRRAESRVRH